MKQCHLQPERPRGGLAAARETERVSEKGKEREGGERVERARLAYGTGKRRCVVYHEKHRELPWFSVSRGTSTCTVLARVFVQLFVKYHLVLVRTREKYSPLRILINTFKNISLLSIKYRASYTPLLLLKKTLCPEKNGVK